MEGRRHQDRKSPRSTPIPKNPRKFPPPYPQKSPHDTPPPIPSAPATSPSPLSPSMRPSAAQVCDWQTRSSPLPRAPLSSGCLACSLFSRRLFLSHTLSNLGLGGDTGALLASHFFFLLLPFFTNPRSSEATAIHLPSPHLVTPCSFAYLTDTIPTLTSLPLPALPACWLRSCGHTSAGSWRPGRYFIFLPLSLQSTPSNRKILTREYKVKKAGHAAACSV